MATGYIILDLQDKNISTTPTHIEGIYERIEGNYRRVLKLHNVTLNNVERPDGFATLSVDGDAFMLVYGNPTRYLEVTNDDMVTLKNFD